MVSSFANYKNPKADILISVSFSGIFKTDGVFIQNSQCSYHIQSDINRTKGNFYSPRYPQNYPKGANCHYIFYGQEDQRVRVKFKNIQLHPTGKR